ncbi:MAG: peptidylprolyl isomerase [Thaumarchaeota archaeon]|nr:peptidylprolyl isomerase [Nitrososphaerota archaeon]
MGNKIRCAHILVAKFNEAQEILDKVKKGESFSKLAGERSLDGSRKRGGDLGYFGRGKMIKDFEKTAFTLEKGQISNIVKTQFGYHIIKRLE